MKIDFNEYLKHRRSAKAYRQDKEISKEVLEQILDAGRHSPSALGLEPWKILVHKRGSSNLREELLPAMWKQESIKTCEYLIIFVSKTKETVINNVDNWLDKRIASKPFWSDKEMQARIKGVAQNLSKNVDSWLESQAHIVVGTMVTMASIHNVDSSPLGGLIAKEELADHLLKNGFITKDEAITAAMTLGFVDESNKPYVERHKRNKDEAVQFIL